MQNTGQETPYQRALREHPPFPNGTWVRYRSQIPGNAGEIIGHSGIYENNAFQQWLYYIIPYGMRYANGGIMMAVERLGLEVTPL